MPSARRPKSRIICGVAKGDMKVEKTPIFMLALLVSIGQLTGLFDGQATQRVLESRSAGSL
jgi:hypothetical protein